jgi:hypothetical protein
MTDMIFFTCLAISWYVYTAGVAILISFLVSAVLHEVI